LLGIRPTALAATLARAPRRLPALAAPRSITLMWLPRCLGWLLPSR
jgi:hypothetical protein